MAYREFEERASRMRPEIEGAVGPDAQYATHLPLHSLRAAAASEPAGEWGDRAQDEVIETLGWVRVQLPGLGRRRLQAAGARRRLLYLRRDDEGAELDVVAEATVEGQTVQVLVGPPEPGTPLPDGIVAYVRRTRRHRLIDDAGFDDLFAHDAYVTTRQVRSVVCVPLLSRQAERYSDRGLGRFVRLQKS